MNYLYLYEKSHLPDLILITMNTAKKIASYFLVILVLLFTVVAILGIWDVLNLEKVFYHFLQSLLIIFIASAVILFIFTVLIKDNRPEN